MGRYAKNNNNNKSGSNSNNNKAFAHKIFSKILIT